MLSIPWDSPQASPSSEHIYAVTNYHVAYNGASIIRLNSKGGKSGEIVTDPSEWFWDSGSDVAIYRIDGAEHFGAESIWKYKHMGFDEVRLDTETIRSYNLGIGDDVFSIGRFVDIHGGERNVPLIRSGIIASSGTVPIRTGDELPWKYENCWIVEMRSRTGFSGSPVFAYIDSWTPRMVDVDAEIKPALFYGPWLLGIHTSQLPNLDERSAGTGMTAVVPCSALEDLLMKNENVIAERGEYERRFVSAPTASAESSEPPATDDNPRHREDFNSLLGGAVQGSQSDKET